MRKIEKQSCWYVKRNEIWTLVPSAVAAKDVLMNLPGRLSTPDEMRKDIENDRRKVQASIKRFYREYLGLPFPATSRK